MQIQTTPRDEQLQAFKKPSLFSPLSPQEAMGIACQVAWQGVGSVGINPLVGSVAVDKNHCFLGAEAHLKFGEQHAEARLLATLTAQGLLSHLEGGTVYVTLEPCSHQGKTPPCAHSLAQFPIKKVVYGAVDPNPLVQGQGLHVLAKKGIETVLDTNFAQKSAPLLEHFRFFMEHKSPFVGLKAAVTLNGAASLFQNSGKEGEEPSSRLAITGPRARAYGHWLRLHYSSILVGAQTIIADNPTLNIRHPFLSGRTPLRIILDPVGRALQHRPVADTQVLAQEPAQTLWVCEPGFWQTAAGCSMQQKLEGLGANTLALPCSEGRFDLKQLLTILGQQQIPSLLLEGGSKVWGSFVNAELVHKLHLFLAPSFLLSKKISLWTEAFAKTEKQVQLSQTELTPLGEDLLLEGRMEFDRSSASQKKTYF